MPKFYSLIKNNICPNFSDRLDFVVCEHSLKVFTLAFGHKDPFISAVSDGFAFASVISLPSFVIYNLFGAARVADASLAQDVNGP